jgi:hypothetical protein
LITARLKFFRQEFDAAVQWAEIAVSEYVRLDSPNHTATAYHILGLAQLYHNDVEAGLTHLNKAEAIWKKIGREDALIHLQHAIAYAEYLTGDEQAALARLADLTAALNASPPSGWRDELLSRADIMRGNIQNGEEITLK